MCIRDSFKGGVIRVISIIIVMIPEYFRLYGFLAFSLCETQEYPESQKTNKSDKAESQTRGKIKKSDKPESRNSGKIN